MFSEPRHRRRLATLTIASVALIALLVALSGQEASSVGLQTSAPPTTALEPHSDYVDAFQAAVGEEVAIREQQERDFLLAVEYVQAVEAEQQRQAAEAERQRQAAADKAAAAKKQAAAKPAAPAASYSGDVWHDLAMCETGGKMNNPNTGNGYYGYFQFSLGTWQSVGGSGYPHEHSYGTQKAFAQKLQARSGWGQWPACSAKLGLR